jgi:hypothetical protein
MARNRCRGCNEAGWLGLRDGSTDLLYHERTTAPGEREVIRCIDPDEETDEEYQERTGEPRGAGRDWAGRVYPDDFADND